jgi:acetyl-CoA synthetase
MSGEALENLSHEDRVFFPSEKFAAQANGKADLYASAKSDREGFWNNQAQNLQWDTKWSQVLDWSEAPVSKWFVGGKLNVSVNCVDRHVAAGNGSRVAIHFEGERGDTQTISYQDLLDSVSQTANALTDLGIKAGDRVAIYMPMIPEAVISMLACARIGAPHSVVFGGFSAESLRSRIEDASASLVITADGGFRKGSAFGLKIAVDEAIENMPSVKKVLVVKRTEQEVNWNSDRDVWWSDIVARQSTTHKPQAFDSEHPLFILYTSGSTGKPKGIKHTTAGYNLYVKRTFEWVFDHKPGQDIFWCTADCGWITGHSYIVYGPLSAGATQVLYEGAPNWPAEDRFWELIEKYKVTILYTAPTAIRAFIKWGDHHVDKHDLSSLRLLGSVGEGINPEAWMWYYNKIGAGRCPIVDTWWQTETGGIMMSPLPGAIPCKPGSCTKPLPGIVPRVLHADLSDVGTNEGGMLCIEKPWPGMLRGIWGDDERFKETYWKKVPHMYLTGDNARQDEDGYYWIMGRIDDVINVSGHRLSTIEIESALVSHPAVAEAAAVGRPDEIKGQGIAVFVTLKNHAPDESIRDELKKHVRKEIGALAVPDEIRFTTMLPKTRSGKIMRRLLRDIASGKENVQDTSTLEDFSVLAKLRSDEES